MDKVKSYYNLYLLTRTCMIQQINFKSNQNDTQANKQAQKGSKLLRLDKSEGLRDCDWVAGIVVKGCGDE